MFGYGKSLLALFIALMSVFAAWVWMDNRGKELEELLKERDEMRMTLEQARDYEVMRNVFADKIDVLRAKKYPLMERFVGKRYEVHQLVTSVVNSASISGMEMVNVFTVDGERSSFSVGSETVSEVLHEIRLHGSYAEFVRFLQSLDDWAVMPKIRSMEITLGEQDSIDRGAGKKSDIDEIAVMLRLSIFVVEDDKAAGGHSQTMPPAASTQAGRKA